MKNFITIIFCVAFVLCLTACNDLVPEQSLQTTAPTETQAVTTVPLTQPPTVTKPTVPQTTVAPEPVVDFDDSEVPYLQTIGRADFPIWSAPGYNNTVVATVKEAGVYTIVQEQYDSEGNLWGKLKSGLGWVDLTLLEREKNGDASLITVSYTEDDLLSSGNYYYCDSDATQYSVTTTLYAHEELTDVSLYPLTFEGDFIPDEEIYHIDYWNPDMPLVAELDFSMDFSSYGIRATDYSGYTYLYTIYQGGRNNEILIRLDN